ncbi:hypothetical protein LEP1GSC016_1101 [Leptospira borgpetersenii serovar Hardjo-bovis str. Sponselee]|uniref:Uncharacterized protein n=1 Tax=Leptospira borgpetersenii serovar Hardjo-bovis str. Sponselee TaxID=1303729 RepID=M6BUV9_LEPBO|nr:hypothetical protein LEP1GSC016_1101 [Leptospira borgpetersenii serovar Hardjo-bovis str. Sponselee]
MMETFLPLGVEAEYNSIKGFLLKFLNYLFWGLDFYPF